jgi:large subunit ribosomal protein L18
MLVKKELRLRRARKTRFAIASSQSTCRLMVHRTNSHLYATIFSQDGSSVLATASTSQASIKSLLLKTTAQELSRNLLAAKIVGEAIAEKAKKLQIEKVAFDRSGFAYHGRIKALAESARAAGLKF